MGYHGRHLTRRDTPPVNEKKTKRKEEHTPLIHEALIRATTNLKAAPSQYFRIKVGNDFLEIGGKTRWDYKESAIRVLIEHLTAYGLDGVRETLPSYKVYKNPYATKQFSYPRPVNPVDLPEDEISWQVYRKDSYTKTDAEKDIKKLIEDGRIQIVELTEI